jgi:hypothetical protein
MHGLDRVIAHLLKDQPGALARGRPLQECGQLASLAAAEIISHIGARPETSLAELAKSNGLAA